MSIIAMRLSEGAGEAAMPEGWAAGIWVHADIATRAMAVMKVVRSEVM
jgi:hypothetical protein